MKQYLYIFFLLFLPTLCVAQGMVGNNEDSVAVRRLPAGANAGDAVYDVVENMPSFKGGHRKMVAFIADNLRYPEKAKKEGKEGLVICSFVVLEDGSVSDVKVARSCAVKEMDDEAVRVISSMPKWNPGTQKGVCVKVRYMVPVRFRLPL